MPARPLLPVGWRATLGVWVALVVLFLGIWQFLPPAAGAEQAPAEPLDLSGMLTPALYCVLGLLLLTIALVIARGQRAERSLLRAAVLIQGDPRAAAELLTRWTRSSLHVAAGRAHLMLAGIAERAADFDVALGHAEAALRRLRTLGVKAAVYDLVLPEVHAMRALALAGLDRRDEAAAELAAIERDFPAFYLLERSRVRVSVLLAVRVRDYRSAAGVASSRSPDLPVSYRDDVLGEIAQLVAPGTPVARSRLNRLRHEIEADPVLAHWLDAAAPDLMDRFDALRAA